MANRLRSRYDSLTLFTAEVQRRQIGKVTLRQDRLLTFLQGHPNVSLLCELRPEARSTATIFETAPVGSRMHCKESHELQPCVIC